MKRDQDNLRVGVIGVGTMGRHHVRIVSQTDGVTLAGLYEPDTARATEFCSLYGCSSFQTIEDLLDGSDAVCVAAPTSTHVEIGEKCLKRGIHVLMEKPLAHNVEGAERLVEAARSGGVVLMVGHVERYNPAVDALMEFLRQNPEEIVSIDTRRLAPFDGSRCLDVDVLYDLLIHDIDLALEIANSPIREVSATARPVFSSQNDVVYARMDFQNRATAVLCASKCSPRKERTISVATPRHHLEANTLTGSLTVHSAETLPQMDNGVCFMGEVTTRELPVLDEEPLGKELGDFFNAVRNNSRPIVSGERALEALKALEMIARAVESAAKS